MKRGNLDTETNMQRKDHVNRQGEDRHSQAQERGLEQILPHSTHKEPTLPTVVLDFQPPELRQYMSLFKPLSLGYFVTAALTN